MVALEAKYLSYFSLFRSMILEESHKGCKSTALVSNLSGDLNDELFGPALSPRRTRRSTVYQIKEEIKLPAEVGCTIQDLEPLYNILAFQK